MIIMIIMIIIIYLFLLLLIITINVDHLLTLVTWKKNYFSACTF
jgi:hypothetical protein